MMNGLICGIIAGTIVAIISIRLGWGAVKTLILATIAGGLLSVLLQWIGVL